MWYLQRLVEALRRRLSQLEEETDHPTLVSMRLLIEEYAEVVAALTRFRTPVHEGSKSSTIRRESSVGPLDGFSYSPLVVGDKGEDLVTSIQLGL